MAMAFMTMPVGMRVTVIVAVRMIVPVMLVVMHLFLFYAMEGVRYLA